MQCVSWRAAAIILETARLGGVDPRSLVQGLTFDETSLRKVRWVGWDEYCALAERLEALVGTERLERVTLERLPIREVHEIAGSILEPRLLFQFIFRVLDPIVFPPVAFRYNDLADGHVQIEWRIRHEARPCIALNRISVGGIKAIPRYLGLPAAKVEAQYDERQCIALVTLPESRTVVARLRRRVRRKLDTMIDLLHSVVDETVSESSAKASSEAPTIGQRLERFGREHQLTRRQLQVLRGIVDGLTNKEIAAQQRCAENTVELHTTNLFRRLNVSSRTQLVSRFWQD
jgi:DNA-binding CsgD family transcriptional regulator